MKKLFLLALTLPLFSGCASDLIDVRPGSGNIQLAQPNQVEGCASEGKIDVSVLAKVGFINRSYDEVEANLLQLARNGAVDAGGDTVVKGPSSEYGRRTYFIYKCR